MPAALMPSIPAWASSKPTASLGLMFSPFAAWIKISGSGLPLESVAGSTITSKSCMTPNLSKINGAFLDADAIAQGIPLCFASSRKVLTPGRRSSGVRL